MLAKYLLLFVATIAVSSAQSDNTVANVLDKIPELQGKVDLKTIEAVQNKTLNEFKSRCENNGGPDAYLRAQNGSQDLYKCVNRLVNTSLLQQEIEDAKPHGNVDEVFKKYCNKKPQFEVCLQEFRNSSSSCFSEQEQGHLKTVYNVSLQLAEFICFKDGDRIALFIAEGGQECFQDKSESLRECFNKTTGQKDFYINSLSEATITFDEKQCKQISELEKCVVEVLMTCPKPTSANIVESLFKFIRKSTPCKSYIENQKDGATTFYLTTATLLTALLVTMML